MDVVGFLMPSFFMLERGDIMKLFRVWMVLVQSLLILLLLSVFGIKLTIWSGLLVLAATLWTEALHTVRIYQIMNEFNRRQRDEQKRVGQVPQRTERSQVGRGSHITTATKSSTYRAG